MYGIGAWRRTLGGGGGGCPARSASGAWPGTRGQWGPAEGRAGGWGWGRSAPQGRDRCSRGPRALGSGGLGARPRPIDRIDPSAPVRRLVWGGGGGGGGCHQGCVRALVGGCRPRLPPAAARIGGCRGGGGWHKALVSAGGGGRSPVWTVWKFVCKCVCACVCVWRGGGCCDTPVRLLGRAEGWGEEVGPCGTANAPTGGSRGSRGSIKYELKGVGGGGGEHQRLRMRTAGGGGGGCKAEGCGRGGLDPKSVCTKNGPNPYFLRQISFFSHNQIWVQKGGGGGPAPPPPPSCGCQPF